MRRLTRGLRVACALGVAGGLLLWTVGAATAAAPTFGVDVLPHGITAGNPALVQGTFTNNGPAVSGVAFTFTFPFNVSVPKANGCASVPLAPKTVACIVGLVPAGGTASKSFQFTVPSTFTGTLTVNGVAGWLSSGPPKAGLLKMSGNATVTPPGANVVIPVPPGGTQQAGASNCFGPGGGTVTSTFDTVFDGNPGSEGASVTAGPNAAGSACTPVTAGVVSVPGSNDLLVVKFPQLVQPAPVTLTFGDETLPFAQETVENGDENTPQYLDEYPNYPSLVPDVTVPTCPSYSGPALPTDPALALSTDACIVSVNPSDPDEDGDAGTISLLVQGSGTGDGGFHGK